MGANMIRDCKHGRQIGKCPECDLADMETENMLLRAHVKRLQRELDLHMSVYRVTVQQRDRAWQELEALATKVASRLEQSGAPAAAGLIREVFINKTHP